jgi:pimeloyl-ACP methyl ester carboxylesterase
MMNTVILRVGTFSFLVGSLVSQLGTTATAIDLPGFGSEKLINDTWGVPEYADWVISQISDREDVILLGHSFGGRITVASKHPHG